MSSSLQLTIAGVDRSANLDRTTWTVSQEFGKRGDRATFDLYDEHADGVLNYVVKPYATVVLKDTGITPNQTIFSGVVPTPSARRVSPNLMRWDLQCLDNTYLADNVVVTGDWINMTGDAIIKAMATSYPVGITTNNVLAGPMIARAKINHLTMSAAWDKIAQLSSQSADFGWYVDENLDLHFYNESQIAALTWYLTDDLTDTNPNAGHYGGSDSELYYEYDGSVMRNRCTVRGGNVTATASKQWTGDGNTSSWALVFPPDTSKISGITLTVGGTSKTIAQDSGGTPTTQYLLTMNPNNQWFLRTGTDPTPGSGVAIVLSYSYQAPVITQVDDPASQAAFSTLPNHGVFQMYVADTSLLNTLSAKARGQRELTQYGSVQERIHLIVSEDFPGHVRAGNIITIKSHMFSDSEQGY
ncbi:MAG: hypothetical protein KGL39_24215, partial [Patescibacteria group bacterium]|nr:hypothetical protein [Patescibacteria group bacterium]